SDPTLRAGSAAAAPGRGRRRAGAAGVPMQPRGAWPRRIGAIAKSGNAPAGEIGHHRRRNGGFMATVNSWIGAPIERREDLRFLRGRGTYVGDLKRENLLHAAVLRSSVAHGR